MMPSKDLYPENVVNPNFQKLLDKFHIIIKNTPKPESTKKELNELKQESITLHVTGRQRDSIIDRCNNYLTGTYESTSKSYAVHQHTKASQNGKP